MGIQNIQIAPSLLAADFARLQEEIQTVEAGGANLLHIDVMDGRFVPNISMGVVVVEAVRRVTKLPLDVHLMIVEPERYVQAFAAAGANMISVHYEASPNLHRTLQMIGDAGARVGLALNPHTSAEMAREVIDLVDYVNVMTVNPGFGGQQFLPTMLPKMARLLAMSNEQGRQIDIEVDGGITEETIVAAVEAGANIIVAGTVIFQHPHGAAAGVAALRTRLQLEMD
ncbi:ribulose-phosphate 3-epimerase [Aggregatilineales bacterium SYSU G02658]